MKDPFINDTPDIFRRMLQNWRNNASFCSIGKITKLNQNPISANIQPLIKHFDNIVKWVDAPELLEIPISQLSNSKYAIKTPLNVGDIGLIIWVDREIFTCLQTEATSTVVPDSGSTEDYNACVFLPIIQSFSKSQTIVTDGIDLVSNEKSLLGNLITEVTKISTLLEKLTTFANAVAASTPTDVGTYAAGVASACSTLITDIVPLKTAIDNIENELTIFKGHQ